MKRALLSTTYNLRVVLKKIYDSTGFITAHPYKLSGRNNVTSDKVNIRPDIIQNFFFVFCLKSEHQGFVGAAVPR